MFTRKDERERVKFRRISKARIFDGHPMKLSLYAVSVLVTAYIIITSIITLLFSYLYETGYILVLWTLIPGALLGLVLLVLERLLWQLKSFMFPQFGKLLTAFLLFFAHMIGYLALSSLVVNYPVGYIMENSSRLIGMASEFSLFSVNFFIILALFSWLRNVRSLPHRCF